MPVSAYDAAGIAEFVEDRRKNSIQLPDRFGLQFFAMIAGRDLALVRPDVFLSGRDTVGVAGGHDGARFFGIGQIKRADDFFQPGRKGQDHFFVGNDGGIRPTESIQ